MGISWIQTIRAASSHIIMKFLALFFVAAAAEPFYPYGVGYAGIAPYAGLKSAPCVNAANIPVPCTYGKREAEPFYPYAGYAAYAGLKSAPCVNAANIPVPCNGVFAYGKREAEAEADPSIVVAGGVVAPYASTYVASAVAPAVAASAPVTTVAAAPAVAAPAVAAPAVATYAAPAVTTVAAPAVAAVAAPAVAGIAPYAGYAAYAGLKSAPCVNAANIPVPCNGVFGYGKREAEPFYAGVYGGYGYNPVHAVAATPFGAVHSSLVGLCTNVNGAQVPC